MSGLVRLVLIMGAVFFSVFVVSRLTGLLSIEAVRAWLTHAEALSPVYVVTAIALLLVVDLYIAVPTTTVVLLGGYFVGWSWGFLAASAGLLAAGIMGFLLARLYGERLVRLVVRDADQRERMRADFDRHGVWMILMSRAVPMLPEISACLAGATGMSFRKFFTAWTASALPYGLVLAYAGSRSSLENPVPAVLAMVGLSVTLGTAWYLFRRRLRPATGVLPRVDGASGVAHDA